VKREKKEERKNKEGISICVKQKRKQENPQKERKIPMRLPYFELLET